MTGPGAASVCGSLQFVPRAAASHVPLLSDGDDRQGFRLRIFRCFSGYMPLKKNLPWSPYPGKYWGDSGRVLFHWFQAMEYGSQPGHF